MEENDLSQYKHQLPCDVEHMTAMADEDLIDLATEAGMKKDARQKFMSMMGVLRKESSLVAMHFTKRFVELLQENDLSQYQASLPKDVERLLGMDKDDVVDFMLDAGMKKDAREKLLRVLDVLREWSLVAEPFLELLEEGGLSKYSSDVLGKVGQVLNMEEEDLLDVAIEAGMKKECRQKFLEAVTLLRSRHAGTPVDASNGVDAWLMVESEPSQNLVDFLAQKGLDKYAKKMCNHANENYGQEEMLLQMGLEDLLEVAVECDFEKEDCRKLGQLVQEESKRRAAAPSVGGRLAEYLTAARTECKKSLTIKYLPFRKVEENCHELSFQSHFMGS